MSKRIVKITIITTQESLWCVSHRLNRKQSVAFSYAEKSIETDVIIMPQPLKVPCYFGYEA